MDKQIIIDICPYQGECSVSGCKRNDDGCFVRQLFEERNRAENRIVELNKSIQAKEQECEKLKNDKFALEVHIDSLTSPVNVDDCEHSVYNGEYIACRYYEGQRCDELDFSNCMFRENVRLKQQVDQLKQTLQEIKELIQSEYCIEIESCEFCDEVGDCLNRKILQKISECEVK